MIKKQSSVEMLWSLIPLHCQIEIEERFRAIKHARQMHQDEIKSAFNQGELFSADYYDGKNDTDENYYNETYGRNNEETNCG
jgi:hypothetical protein